MVMQNFFQHYLNRVQKVSYIPASAIFTSDQSDDLSERSDITWGDMDKSLLKPSRLIGPEWDDDMNDLFRFLDASNVYIDLEN